MTVAVRPMVTPPIPLAPAIAATMQPVGPADRNLRATLHHLSQYNGSLVIWTGHPGVGRTVAARWLMHAYNMANRHEHASDLLLVASDSLRRNARTMRHAILDLHERKLPGAYASRRATTPPAMLCDEILAACREDETSLLVLKEINPLSIEELCAYGLLLSATQQVGQHLNLLLLARPCIHRRIGQQPALTSHVTLRCDFPSWKADAVVKLCITLAPALECVFDNDPLERDAFIARLMTATEGRVSHMRVFLDQLSRALERKATMRPSDLLDAILTQAGQAEKACEGRIAANPPRASSGRPSRALPQHLRKR